MRYGSALAARHAAPKLSSAWRVAVMAAAFGREERDMRTAVLPFLNGLGLSCHGSAQLGQASQGYLRIDCIPYQFGL
jgi:hypothetical protein